MANTNWYPAAEERGVVGRFEYLDVLDVPASLEADEERTKQIIVLREKVAASTDDTVRKVRPETQQTMTRRFPDAWKAFQGEVVKIAGTPLSALGLNDDRITVFRLHGIMTVEQLSEVSDANCSVVGFGTKKLRDEAKAYLEKARNDRMEQLLAAPVQPEPSNGMAQRDGESIGDFLARVTAAAAPEQAEAPVKRKPGRPRQAA